MRKYTNMHLYIKMYGFLFSNVKFQSRNASGFWFRIHI